MTRVIEVQHHTADSATRGGQAGHQKKNEARRPLHVGLIHGARIAFRDNALWVQPAGRSASLVSLTRLCRVVTGPRAEWQGAALLGCCAGGVPVIMLDAHGRVQGCLEPVPPRAGSLVNVFEQFAAYPRWPDLLADWARARRQDLWLSRYQREGWLEDSTAQAREAAHEVKRTFVHLDELPMALQPILHGLVHAAVVDRLGHHHLPVSLPATGGDRLELAAIIARLCLGALCLNHGGLLATATDMATAARIFQALTMDVETEAEVQTNALCLHIRKVVNLWP